MTYRCDLGMGQYLSVENRDENGAEHTVITLAMTGPGQQQQSSCTLMTGRWLELPQVFRSGHQVVLRLTTTQGDRFLYIEGQSITAALGAVDLSQAQPMPMVWVESVATSMPPMTPMTPMPPMTPMQPMSPPMAPMTPIDNRGVMSMGTMQMSMKPMEMRLGNMVMRADAIASESTAQSSSQASAQSGSHTTGSATGYAETAAESATAESAVKTSAESAAAAPSSSPRFCSQCGVAVKSGDRFCASCGHRLG